MHCTERHYRATYRHSPAEVSENTAKYWVKYGDHLIVFLGAKLDKRGVDFLVDGATHGIIDNGSTRQQQQVRVYDGRRGLAGVFGGTGVLGK